MALTVESAIKSGRLVEVSPLGEIKRIGLGKKFKRMFNKRYENERIGRIATLITQKLSEKCWSGITQANEDETLRCARKFIKKTNKKQKKDPRIQALSKQILASKLNLSVEVLEKHSGFEAFVRKYHIDRQLLHYGHDLKVTSNQEIQLLDKASGEYIKWSAVPENIRNAPCDKKVPNEPWVYSQDGLHCEDMYNWTELKPYKIENPNQWDNQYVFEYCVCCEHKVRLQGDHTWIRLKTPEGEIYSIGLYRPSKNGKRDNYQFPFRVKEGHLMQPDVSEFYPGTIHKRAFKITEAQFKEIKRSIEKDKANEDQTFLLIESNCTKYTNRMARKAGIDIPTGISLFRFITPKVINRMIGLIPRLIRKILYAIIVPFGNMITLALGSGKVDKKVRHRNVKPHIRTFWDIFKPSKLIFHPPIYVGIKLFRQIDRWREKELKKAKSEKEKLRIRYDLPPEFRVDATG